MQKKIDYYYDYINYLIECEQYEKAIKNIENWSNENIFYLKFKKAYCFYKLDKYLEAIDMFDKCLDFNQEQNICNIYIGLCNLKLNDFNNGIYRIEKQLLINQDVLQKQEENKVITNINPDLFCCPLTLDIYKDPYITPNGNTYEHAALVEHLNNVGKFDPLTREYLDENMIIPNRKIKELIENN